MKSPARYNQTVRIRAVSAAFLMLAACQRGSTNEAIRQAVMDRLRQPGMGLNMDAMDVNLTSVKVAGAEADATVQLTLKDAKDMPGMTVQYHLRQDGKRWVVTGLLGSGMGSHAGGAAPPAGNPHSSLPDAGGTERMPAPGDLPPSGKGK